MSSVREIVLPVTLEHDLRSGDADNMLVIDGGNHSLEFDPIITPDEKGRMLHTITLQLTGNASSGVFMPIVDPQYPAFTWLVRTPRAIMLDMREKEIRLVNHHHGRETRGHWYYQLFARFGTTFYGVPLIFSAGGGGNTQNPSIKNR